MQVTISEKMYQNAHNGQECTSNKLLVTQIFLKRKMT